MAEGAGERGGKLVKLIIYAVVALVFIGLVGAGGWAAYHFLLSGTRDSAGGKGGTSASLGKEAEPLENPRYLALGDSFIVNLADGRRYLKATVVLKLSDEKAEAYLKTRLVEIRDLVISELQTLSTEQLRDPKERELLKQRLLRKVESLLPNRGGEWKDPRPLRAVLITEFYLQ
ncbi:MAG: flagellar basal body-associated FliL family protein [Candidatus Lambdaproteobacteria bacterium]|nr:flagellar basal body-associated FliL family protein [Candidatus Lambdaproteobacteria bacterium]